MWARAAVSYKGIPAENLWRKRSFCWLVGRLEMTVLVHLIRLIFCGTKRLEERYIKDKRTVENSHYGSVVLKYHLYIYIYTQSFSPNKLWHQLYMSVPKPISRNCLVPINLSPWYDHCIAIHTVTTVAKFIYPKPVFPILYTYTRTHHSWVSWTQANYWTGSSWYIILPLPLNILALWNQHLVIIQFV